jgi:hypothetical protein
VLSRNEVERDYAYNRALFVRVEQGWYQFNPKLAVRRKDGETDLWVPIYRALNLPFINEFAIGTVWERINRYLAMAGLPERAIPVSAERAIARIEAAARERSEREAKARAAQERWLAEQEARRQQRQVHEPKWGTPEAKRREIERIRKEIERRNKG